jgi:hypothetical protein
LLFGDLTHVLRQQQKESKEASAICCGQVQVQLMQALSSRDYARLFGRPPQRHSLESRESPLMESASLKQGGEGGGWQRLDVARHFLRAICLTAGQQETA